MDHSLETQVSLPPSLPVAEAGEGPLLGNSKTGPSFGDSRGFSFSGDSTVVFATSTSSTSFSTGLIISCFKLIIVNDKVCRLLVLETKQTEVRVHSYLRITQLLRLLELIVEKWVALY